MDVESGNSVSDAFLSSVDASHLFVAFDLASLASLLLRILISLLFDIIMFFIILSIS